MFAFTFSRWVGCLLLAITALVPPSSDAAPGKSEADLIAMLRSQNYKQVLDALDRLPNWYPNSTTAVQEIRKLLGTRLTISGVPPNYLSRKVARSLGNYHATLNSDEVKLILGFVRSAEIDDVMDGLKALRGLKEPAEIEEKIAAELVLLLQDKEPHVVRDAIRTLGVVGNKETIPAIEPFLRHLKLDVKRDAREAITALEKKPVK